MKRCPDCTLTKNTSEFGNNRSTPDGKEAYCKACKKKQKDEERNNSVYVFLKDVVRCAKYSVKKRKLGKVEITINDLLDLYEKQQGKCAISGIEMTHIAGKGKVSTNISIDRKDNTKGYKKDNIQLLCFSMNALKLNMNEEELNSFLQKLTNNFLKSNEQAQIVG